MRDEGGRDGLVTLLEWGPKARVFWAVEVEFVDLRRGGAMPAVWMRFGGFVLKVVDGVVGGGGRCRRAIFDMTCTSADWGCHRNVQRLS